MVTRLFKKKYSHLFQDKNKSLKSRAAQLERQIKVLIDDSVALLRSRISELGMTAANPEDLLNRAKVNIFFSYTLLYSRPLVSTDSLT